MTAKRSAAAAGLAEDKKDSKKGSKAPKAPIDDIDEDIDLVDDEMDEEQEEEGVSPTKEDLESEDESDESMGCPLAQNVLAAHAAGRLSVSIAKSKAGRDSLKIQMNNQPVRGDSGPWVASFVLLKRYGTLLAHSVKMKTPAEKAWSASHKLCINTDQQKFVAANTSLPQMNGTVCKDLERVAKEWRQMMEVLSQKILEAAWDTEPYASAFKKSTTRMFAVTKDKAKAREAVETEFKDQFLPAQDLESEDVPPISLWLERAAFKYAEGDAAIKSGPPFDPAVDSLPEYIKANWPMREHQDFAYRFSDGSVIPVAEEASEGVFSHNDEVVTPGSLINVGINMNITLRVDDNRVRASVRPKLSLGQSVQIIHRAVPGTYSNGGGSSNGDAGALGSSATPPKKQDYASRYGAKCGF